MTLTAEHVFPPGFLWGTATAAHQVEGGNHNNWSAWEAGGGGRIFGDHVSGTACDWWGGRWREDFDRAAGLHNNALRLSLEWSRIEPQPGRWDEDALAHYRDMAAGLRARGLEPLVTLHHFTHPLWVEERGGWLSEDTPGHFARFCQKVVAALGDQVTLWCTINEPMVYSTLSYAFGRWPPGHTSLDEALRVAVNMVRGHAEAYYAIHDAQPEAQVGFAKHQLTFEADSPLALPGARLLTWLFDEAIFGAFTRGQMRLPGHWLRAVRLPRARHTLDWVGLQYYQHFRVRLTNDAPDFLWFRQYARSEAPHGPPGWGELAPRDLYGHIKRLWKLTGRPIYITEAGVPDADDSIRPAYLARTVRAVWDTVNGNLPVWGFFFWSLLDNFEWAEGYDPRFRFGLYGVDFATQERTERTSARLYRAICSANALSAEVVRQYAPDALDELYPEPRRTFA